MAQQQNTTNYTPLLIAAGVLLVWDKIFGKSEGEKQSEAEQKKLDDAPQTNNPTLENYKPPVKNIPKGATLFRKSATKILLQSAKDIKNSIGLFTDDEAKIVNAFKRAITKTEINLIARYYSALYKRDLMFDIKDNLSAKELLPIYKYINSLPDYTRLK